MSTLHGMNLVVYIRAIDPYEAVSLLPRVVCACRYLRRRCLPLEKVRREREAALRRYPALDPKGWHVHPDPTNDGPTFLCGMTESDTETVAVLLSTVIYPIYAHVRCTIMCVPMRDVNDAELTHRIFIVYVGGHQLYREYKEHAFYPATLQEHDSSYRIRSKAQIIDMPHYVDHFDVIADGKYIGHVVRYDASRRVLVWVSSIEEGEGHWTRDCDARPFE